MAEHCGIYRVDSEEQCDRANNLFQKIYTRLLYSTWAPATTKGKRQLGTGRTMTNVTGPMRTDALGVTYTSS